MEQNKIYRGWNSDWNGMGQKIHMEWNIEQSRMEFFDMLRKNMHTSSSVSIFI